MRPTTAAILVLSLLLAACTGGGAATTISSPTTTAETASSTTTEPTTTTTLPATVNNVQEAIDWFVGLLNGAEVTSEEYEARFSEAFREQVSFEPDFQSVLTQFRAGSPYVVTERAGDETSGEAIVEAAGGERLRVVGALDAEGRLDTLFIQPAELPELEDPPDTVGEAFERLSELGTSRALTAEIVDGSCQPMDTSSPNEPAPLGSVFKLYVLATLGETVDAGTISWDDEIEISDDLKSIPSGVLQNRPDGTAISVRETAELMISISDNTATDHLIDLVGREAVEATLAEYGNSVPELNIPFLTTREFAALKVGPASGLSTQWVPGDEEARREILDQIAGITPDDIPVQDWIEPIMPETIEWFATPMDLCRLAVEMEDLVDRVPEIAEILEINPGVPDEDGVWDRIWFKGGSEPGVLAMWWRTEVDGRVFVTTGSVVDPESNFDQTQAVLLLAAARDLLAP